jgi:RNA polymerase sigma factor (sigma-70 family)
VLTCGNLLINRLPIIKSYRLASNLAHMTDEELLSLYYQEGNNDWLGILLERYTMLLLGVCMKYLKDEELAKDTVQQVFLKAISEVAKSRIDNMGGWLYRVAKNQCLTLLRDRRLFLNQEVLENLPQPDETPIHLHWKHVQDVNRLQRAMATLKEEQRTAVRLFYLEQKSYAEIALATQWTISQVKSYIQNGKRNLRIKLDEQSG